MGVNLPIQNYFKPKPTPQDWVRPSDWPIITDTANEVQFLMSDINQGVFTIRTQFTRTTGNIYIDWGDGSGIDTITTTGTTNTSHQYTAGTGTPCSRGYTTFKVRVYGDPTCEITLCQPVAPVGAGNSNTYQMGLLEVYYGNGTIATNAPSYGGVGSAAPIIGGFGYLEYVKLPQSVSWTTGTNFMFSQNQTIQKVILPTVFTSNTSIRHFFSGCTNLKGEYDFSMLTGLTGSDLESTFLDCSNVTKIILPSTTLTITTLNSTFFNCNSLKNLSLPNLPNVTNFNQTFRECYSLEWVKFDGLPSFASSTAVNCVNTFLNCVSLENVYLPATCSSNAKYDCGGMFSTCVNLKSVILPVGFDSTNILGMFTNCHSLVSVKFQNAFSACSNISAFGNCFNLYDLTLPSDLGTPATATTMFQSCRSLETVVFPSTYNFTGSLSNMFFGCANLKTVTFPNTAQNAITSLNGTFNGCAKLENITLPSSMTGATDMTNMFNNCYVLKSVTLPSTMNSVTTMLSCFSNCFSLESVIMPTSMSSCNIFNIAFNKCKELTTLTMPATVATGTNWASAFSQCINLKTLTLPTTQTTTLTDLNAAFNSCGSLVTVNNTDKLGTLGATPLVNLSINNGATSVASLTFRCPMSIFAFHGTASGFNALTSLRFLNTSSGQWTGGSPQINVGNTSLSTAALVQLFNDISAQGTVTGKTINITSATGAAGLTPANRAIITSIGWTIIG